jgi:hypothetical protein
MPEHAYPSKTGVFLPYLKAYAALVGSICTALLGVYAADSQVGKILTVVSVIATVVATWAVPNVPGRGAPRGAPTTTTPHDDR